MLPELPTMEVLYSGHVCITWPDITFMGRDQELQWLALAYTYTLSFFLYSLFNICLMFQQIKCQTVRHYLYLTFICLNTEVNQPSDDTNVLSEIYLEENENILVKLGQNLFTSVATNRIMNKPVFDFNLIWLFVC